jgi:transposase-like protein
MSAPDHRRLVERDNGVVSIRRQCELFRIARSGLYRPPAAARRGSSVEEALIEMYLAGVSVRRVEDITEALWGTRVSPSTAGVDLFIEVGHRR